MIRILSDNSGESGSRKSVFCHAEREIKIREAARKEVIVVDLASHDSQEKKEARWAGKFVAKQAI